MDPIELTHPTKEQLERFGLGRLTHDEAAAIESHVAECAECTKSLESVANDTLIGLLRESTTLLPGKRTADQRPTSPAPDTSIAAIPRELANHPRYEVLELIGQGGMGAVYKAQHRVMGRLVALKTINPNLVQRSDAIDRFHREVQAAARLAHPNIVTAYDAETAGWLHFLVMEFVHGRTVADMVQDHGPLTVARACDYVRQAALGLQHAMDRGMVHRDIKPQNLIVTTEGELKILDFGLARLASENSDAAITESGALMGTADYLAPEQASDAHNADIRSDIYSLGCSLYFMLAGHPPFPQGTLVQKVMAHRELTPKLLGELRPDVPIELERVVARMMARNPSDRFQSPVEVANALRPFALPPKSTDTVQPGTGRFSALGLRHPGRPPRRLRLALAAAGTLIAIAAIVTYSMWLHQNTQQGTESSSGQDQPDPAQNVAKPPPRVVAIWIKDSSPDDFVARADLDRFQWQQQAEECMNDGLRPACINGYQNERGETRYAGLWIESSSTESVTAKHDMDMRQFSNEYETIAAGYRPIWLDSYGTGSNRRFAAVWINDGREIAWRMSNILGESAALSDATEMEKQGYRPAIITGNTGATGITLFTQIFVKSAEPYRLLIDLSFETLTEKINGLESGWRPAWIDSYSVGSSQRYALIAVRDDSGTDWTFSSAESIDNYTATFEQHFRDGLRPILISVN